MRPITEIVIHCADTPPNMDIGAFEINEWHVKRGFLCIGYHLVVRRNGSVEAGRPLSMIGAHVEGHNANSIGVCLVGSKGDHTPAQWARAALLCADLLTQFGLPPTALKGHRDYPGVTKTCPDFDVTTELTPSVVKILSEPHPDTSHETGDDHASPAPTTEGNANARD